MSRLRDILVKRDKITEEEANDIIDLAKGDLLDRLAEGREPADICREWFGLEPSYIIDLYL